ncbi:FK506-binding protein 3-like [Durio zibethinus]|uniref:FK506-binding protein 3-like n=1 Tax=Durio zibethinus TaxID=66656 RepID=A0A6P5XRB1_DURZI|nr:FK506-binding protein 3-like [Durio zibethinus]
MVGGGNSRRDESLVINSTNVFAALGSLKKKKKKGSEKEHQGSSSKSKGKKEGEKEAEKKEVFWAPSPLKVKSWADVDEEDDDDYYATMAPPGSAWDTHKEPEPILEGSESEEEGLDEVDDDVEEEHENEAEALVEVQPVVNKPPKASMVTKETERQLSKKELKKKELEELDAVLAELGYTKQETGIAQRKNAESNGEMEKIENAPAESKSAKKKKKKDKSSKEVKESSQAQPKGIDAGNDAEETGETKKPEETSAVDVKERLKKVVSRKKKKSSKEMDAAAQGAASEAAARSAKLTAAKKKEKNHYNQQPVR